MTSPEVRVQRFAMLDAVVIRSQRFNFGSLNHEKVILPAPSWWCQTLPTQRTALLAAGEFCIVLICNIWVAEGMLQMVRQTAKYH